jgi:hypothetical protein
MSGNLPAQTEIFIVSTIKADDSKRHPLGRDTRSWGYGWSFDDAEEMLYSDIDDECGYYKYAVIEMVSPGVYTQALALQWYVSDNGVWAKCDRPEEYANIINFGIG